LTVFSRYVVLPGGRQITLADDFGGDFAGPAAPRARRRSRRPSGAPGRGKNLSRRAKKIMAAGGTRRQHRRW